MKAFINRHKLLYQHTGAALFFFLLTIAVTWPLILHFGNRVPGYYLADNYEYLWKMWWFKHALLDLHTNPLIVPTILFPQGFPLAFAEITPLHTLLGLPLTVIFGEIAAYNFFAILSFVLAGWATYLLVLHWTDNPWAGLLAGVLFVLNPYHVIRYGGILPLMSIEGLPVFLLGIELWISSRRFRWILLASLGYLLAAWASIYYAFGLLLLGPLYLLVRFFTSEVHVLDRKTVAHLAGLLLLVGAITLPLAVPYLTLHTSADLSIPLEETDYWSASPTDYLLPSGIHPLWGNWVIQNALGVPGNYEGIALEFIIAGGFVALLFAIYGAQKSAGKEKKAILALTAAALMLSFGTTLHIARHPVVLPAPQAVIDSFNRGMESIGGILPAHESFAPLETHGITIPLPALFLRWVIPSLTGLRGWNRFAAFTSLGLALLAGLGFALWLKTEIQPGHSRRKTGVAILVFFALALFELWPQSIPLQAVGPRPVDLWLASQPDPGSIMELPLTSALSAPELLYTRYHGKPITFAYGTFLPYWYRQQYPELENCPETKCIERLRSWGVAYLLLNRKDPSEGLDLEYRLDHSPSLERVIQIGDFVVYRLLY